MEAFEKKWKDWGCSVDCDIEKGCDRCEKMAEYWYRVALEWVMSCYKELDMEDWDVVACRIKDQIEKELEN